MTAALDPVLLREASDLIAGRMGLHFPEERWPDLARGLQAAEEELACGNLGALVTLLRSGKLSIRQIETLAGHLTVGETYFFRDPATFEWLEREILPSLFAARSGTDRTVRLWSAGCCTGEEAYSLAITYVRAQSALKALHFSILATDINLKFLAKASEGTYGEWSFRGAPIWLRERFFSSLPERRFALDPAIKSLVRFDYLNLAEDVYPSLHNNTNVMDVIFCRNVLMYFTPGHQRRVLAALHRCLVDGGCLLVNPAETSAALFPLFTMENHGGIILYRKTSKGTGSGSRRESSAPASVMPMPVFISTPPPPAPDPGDKPALALAPPLDAIATMPGDILEQARAYADQGRLVEALASCRKALAAECTNLAGHFMLAMICQELGLFQEGIDALRKVLYLDQDFILAHHALIQLYRRVGKQRESGRHLAVTLELLSASGKDEIVPESGGMTCGRLLETVRLMVGA